MSKYVVNLMEIVELDEGKDKTLYYNEELEIDNLDTFNVDEHYRNQSKKSNRIIIPLDIQEI